MKPVLVVILALATSRVAHGSGAHQSRVPEPVAGNVVISQIGPDVYAAIRTEPLGLAVNSNSLFIVNDQDVVVVDAQFTRAATLENIAALRQITRKPVRYVINTHWHDDHVAGNQVYRDSFPGVEFIAQTSTRADIVALGRPNRAGQVAGAPPAADRFERLLAMGLGGDSTPASPAERVSLTSAINIIRRYVAENAGFHEILPDTVVDRSMTLVRGVRTIELHWFGRANTRGDLVTYLPKDGIVSTGDLVVAPIPFGFNSYPSEWIAVLDSVMALKPKVIVPGHGPLMHNLAYVQTVRRMLATARERTREAAEKGLTRDSVLRVVQLDDLRAEVAGDDKWMRTMFGMFFRQPVVGRVFDEVKNGPLK